MWLDTQVCPTPEERASGKGSPRSRQKRHARDNRQQILILFLYSHDTNSPSNDQLVPTPLLSHSRNIYWILAKREHWISDWLWLPPPALSPWRSDRSIRPRRCIPGVRWGWCHGWSRLYLQINIHRNEDIHEHTLLIPLKWCSIYCTAETHLRQRCRCDDFQIWLCRFGGDGVSDQHRHANETLREGILAVNVVDAVDWYGDGRITVMGVVVLFGRCHDCLLLCMSFGSCCVCFGS